MKEFDWRVKYAPHGYSRIQNRITFHALQSAYSPSGFLRLTIEWMRLRMIKECPYFFDGREAQTFITVWPRDVGEDLNHLDPLKPRLGLEIEIRQPMSEDITP